MRLFENHTFDWFSDFDSGATFSDLEFRNCAFESSSVSVAHAPATRTIVRNLRFIGCSQLGCGVGSAIVEDTFVDGFKTHGQPLMTWGAVFKHVTLRGKIDFLLSPALKSERAHSCGLAFTACI